MVVTSKPMTLEKFLELPEEKPALEFFDGVVSQKVSPTFVHGLLQTAFAAHLDSVAHPKRLGVAVSEVRCIFAGETVVPDVSYFVWDRIPRDDQGQPSKHAYAPPDIIIEIVSPDQSANALYRRCLWYIQNGVRIALQVDPGDRSILRFLEGRAAEVLQGEDRIDLDSVLPGFAMTVEELFKMVDVSRPASRPQ